MMITCRLLLLLLVVGCNTDKTDYKSDTLEIIKISSNTYIHTSYLDFPDYDRYPCNGLVYIIDKEAIVLDSPTNNYSAKELVNWIEVQKESKIKAVVVSHFHEDCLGGLEVFHKKNINSYANNLTLEICKIKNEVSPLVGFENSLELKIGDDYVKTQYFGQGHTKDNVVSYINRENILFGGCLIKELGAKKGNLKDSNLSEWSNTVKKVKQKYKNAKYIVPGHGKYGGAELLDYTIELFNDIEN